MPVWQSWPRGHRLRGRASGDFASSCVRQFPTRGYWCRWRPMSWRKLSACRNRSKGPAQMAKLQKVTDAEMAAASDAAGDVLATIADIANRLEKGYSDGLESPV